MSFSGVFFQYATILCLFFILCLNELIIISRQYYFSSFAGYRIAYVRINGNVCKKEEEMNESQKTSIKALSLAIVFENICEFHEIYFSIYVNVSSGRGYSR